LKAPLNSLTTGENRDLSLMMHGIIASPLREQQLLLLLKDARRWVRSAVRVESAPDLMVSARRRCELIWGHIRQRSSAEKSKEKTLTA